MLTEQDKRELKIEIQSNKHQVYIVSIKEMDAIIRSAPAGKKPKVQAAWLKIKAKAEAGANYTASTSDMVTLTKLVGDLGGVGAKVYVKNYGGKPHIILKGHPGLRRVLTGTKYGIKNPKVITMGLGKAGAVNAAKMGGIISVVLLTVYHVADYFLTDQATLSRLVGHLAVDIVKVGITTGVAIAAAHVAVAITTIAVGPILAVIAVGVGLTMGLNALDEHYGISERIVEGLDELSSTTVEIITKQKQNLIDLSNNAVDSLIDYAVTSVQRITINLARNTIQRYFQQMRRFN